MPKKRWNGCSLYTGFTTDLLHRLQIHNQGKGAKYTRARRPVHLVWYQEFLTEHDARSLEAQIKNWKKKEKEKLVATFQEGTL